MNSKELYKTAYDLHYKFFNLDEAIKEYQQIIDEFPDSPEASYAKTQIANIQKMSEAEREKYHQRIVKVTAQEAYKMDQSNITEADLDKIIITTTHHIEGYQVVKYLGLVSYQYVIGTGFMSELNSSFGDFFGLRANPYEEKIASAQDESLKHIKYKVVKRGGNAVVGLTTSYVPFANDRVGVMMMGTAVRVESSVSNE